MVQALFFYEKRKNWLRFLVCFLRQFHSMLRNDNISITFSKNYIVSECGSICCTVGDFLRSQARRFFMSNFTKDEELIIHKAIDVFGQKDRIEDYSDERKKHGIHVVACENHPRPDVTAYATLGGHQCPTGYTVGGIPLRIEIVGACHEEFGIYSAILANCIFHMMKSHVSIFPGAIYKDVITVLDDSFHMQHILLIPPFLWDNFSTIELSDKKVTFLQAVPISENERAFALEYGVDSLLSRFDAEQVNVFNLERRSVV